MHYLAVPLLAALALGFVPQNQDAEPTRALEEGEALLRAGKLDEAEARFGEAVRLAPDRPRAQYYLGVVRLRLGRTADAVGPLETARRLSPRANPAVLYELGTAYLKLERYEEAAAVLELASSAVPADTGFRLQLGYAFYKLLAGEKAEAEFEAVLSKEPRNPLARFYLGLTQAALGRLSEAEASFRLALETQPDLTDARLALARTLSQSDRDEEARAELDEVLTASPEGGEAALAAHNELGLISLRAADLDGARRHFEAVVRGTRRRSPGDLQPLAHLLEARHDGGGERHEGPLRSGEIHRDRAPIAGANVGFPAEEASMIAALKALAFGLVLALSSPSALSSGTRSPLTFVDVTRKAGISFHHQQGASGRRYMVEIAGGGVLVFDYDGDGAPDLYFVNGAPLPGDPEPPRPSALYRNVGGGRFVNVTREAGLEGHGYGMGGSAADIDDDGNVDLLVTAFGANHFYRNRGDGTFVDETAAAGLGDERWATSAAFFDADADGFVDLYVADYLDFTLETQKVCVSPTKGIVSYCHPQEYPGMVDRFYGNRGDGTFTDRTEESGIAVSAGGKGLGVTAADYDDDGDVDVYVANDTTANFLFQNDGHGRFREVALESGVAFNEEGLPEAGMGTDWGDFDRDGRLDLVVTNFDFETNTLYRNLGGGFFFDATTAAGLGDRSLTELAFGCDLADFDNDGWLDWIVTNGHILDNIAEIQPNLSFAEPGQFFWNRGGKFEDLSLRRG